MCIKDQKFGVVYPGRQRTVCATCSSTNCAHVCRLQKVIQEYPYELPSQLKPFTEFETLNKPARSKLPAKAISSKEIPFILTERLRDRLKEDHTTRFQIHDGAANLKPVELAPSLCLQCGSIGSWSTETYLSQEIFLVTPLCCYPAKGIIY